MKGLSTPLRFILVLESELGPIDCIRPPTITLGAAACVTPTTGCSTRYCDTPSVASRRESSSPWTPIARLRSNRYSSRGLSFSRRRYGQGRRHFPPIGGDALDGAQRHDRQAGLIDGGDGDDALVRRPAEDGHPPPVRRDRRAHDRRDGPEGGRPAADRPGPEQPCQKRRPRPQLPVSSTPPQFPTAQAIRLAGMFKPPVIGMEALAVR